MGILEVPLSFHMSPQKVEGIKIAENTAQRVPPFVIRARSLHDLNNFKVAAPRVPHSLDAIP